MPISPGLRIGRILGIPIYVHASWMIIFVLITMSLAVQFAQEHPQWTSVQHWSVGIATSLLFFASVLFHELAHSVVARFYKIRVVSITLFVFGGVARIGREPSKAIQEFNIAIAGPLASLFLALGFYSLTLFFPYAQMTGALALWFARGRCDEPRSADRAARHFAGRIRAGSGAHRTPMSLGSDRGPVGGHDQCARAQFRSAQ